MSRRDAKKGKNGTGSVRIRQVKELKPERKKGAGRWFSLDSLMGKALCVLLVVILTVGAFLAPKIINNLYDAGTLMQITYMDMDISPYAVPYTTFQDKIEAMARARTAGKRLTALPVEETADRISDEELVEIVNEEMGMAENSMNPLFIEAWWDAHTVDNLVSREKHTVYMRTPAGQEDAPQEMTPFQVWTLTFEVTEKQDELVVYSGKDKRALSQFATDRLIVCMDADFYKIVAIALQGERDKSREMYGWDMVYAFGADPEAPSDIRKAAALYSDDLYMSETQVYLASEIWAPWVDYWDLTLKDYLLQVDDEGTLGAYLIFEHDMAVSDAGKYTDLMDNAATGIYDSDGTGLSERVIWTMEEVIRAMEGGGMFLEAGSRIEWEGGDDNIWILKTGCMEFFEMMQF